jgi:hypothetical protein
MRQIGSPRQAPLHEESHPSSSLSIRVSRQRSFFSPAAIRNHLIRASDAPRFTFIVYGLELFVSVWFMSIVLALVVACFFGCFSSPILAVPLYISFCMYPLPKRHMMGVHVWVSPGSVFIIVSACHLLPSALVFFYSAENKQQVDKLPWWWLVNAAWSIYGNTVRREIKDYCKHQVLLHSKSQVLLSTTSLLRIGLSPRRFSHIPWVNENADDVCVFSSSPSSRHVGSPSQVLSSAVLPVLQLPPHGVRGGRITLDLSADYTHTIITYVAYFTPYGMRGGVCIQQSSVTYVLALDT